MNNTHIERVIDATIKHINTSSWATQYQYSVARDELLLNIVDISRYTCNGFAYEHVIMRVSIIDDDNIDTIVDVILRNDEIRAIIYQCDDMIDVIYRDNE